MPAKSRNPVSFSHLMTLAVFLSAALPASAAEVALLAGRQFDADVEISTADQWPPENPPTGVPGQAIGIDNDSSWAIAFNADYQGRENQKIGLFYSRHETAFDIAAGLADPALEISLLHFVGTNIYPQGERLSYFVLAGVGAAFYEPEDSTLKDVTRFSAQIGGGANIRLADNFFLQLEARWLPAFFNSETAVFCSGGCTVAVAANSYSQIQVNAGVMLRF